MDQEKVPEIYIQTNPYGICDGQSGRWTIISPSTSFSRLCIIPPMIHKFLLSSRNETTKIPKLAGRYIKSSVNLSPHSQHS